MSEYEAKRLKLDEEIMQFQIETELNLTLRLNLNQAFIDRRLNSDKEFNEGRTYLEENYWSCPSAALI